MLAYACSFTTKCPSLSCTEANTETILLSVLVRGLADVDTQAEILAGVEQMSLGDTVAFIAVREADAIAANAKKPVRTVNPNAQHVTGLKVTPPSPMPPEQMENVKMQLTVNINTNTGPPTNISQLL